MKNSSKLDMIDTLGDVWTDIEHLKERVLMHDDANLKELDKIQKMISRYRGELAEETKF